MAEPRVFPAGDARRGAVLAVVLDERAYSAAERLCQALAGEGWDLVLVRVAGSVEAGLAEAAQVARPDAVIALGVSFAALSGLIAATAPAAVALFDPSDPADCLEAPSEANVCVHLARDALDARCAARFEEAGARLYLYDASGGFMLDAPDGDAAVLAGLRLRRQLLRGVGGRESGA